MQIFLLLVLTFFISGCAGMLDPPTRWVSDNIFHSTKSPGISIKVDKSMIYHPTEAENSMTTTAEHGFTAGMTTEWFKFRDKSRQKALNIKIETLAHTNRIYMARPDYSEWKNVISSDTEKINNEMFSTGVLAVYDKYTSLVKAYGKIIDDTIRYQIFYLEKVDSDWSKKNPNYLSREEQDFLSGFNKRANASFSIGNYLGDPPPGQLSFKKQKSAKDAGINEPFIDPTTGMEFVHVKGGCYQMGDTFGDGFSSENPVHDVCLDGFYMGKYEVTKRNIKR